MYQKITSYYPYSSLLDDYVLHLNMIRWWLDSVWPSDLCVSMTLIRHVWPWVHNCCLQKEKNQIAMPLLFHHFGSYATPRRHNVRKIRVYIKSIHKPSPLSNVAHIFLSTNILKHIFNISSLILSLPPSNFFKILLLN